MVVRRVHARGSGRGALVSMSCRVMGRRLAMRRDPTLPSEIEDRPFSRFVSWKSGGSRRVKEREFMGKWGLRDPECGKVDPSGGGSSLMSSGAAPVLYFRTGVSISERRFSDCRDMLTSLQDEWVLTVISTCYGKRD